MIDLFVIAGILGLFSIIFNISIYFMWNNPASHAFIQGFMGQSVLIHMEWIASNLEIIVPFGIFLLAVSFFRSRMLADYRILLAVTIFVISLSMYMSFAWGL